MKRLLILSMLLAAFAARAQDEVRVVAEDPDTVRVSENAALLIQPDGGGGVSDHGALTGLGDDDHPQYLNVARGDDRYLTSESDPMFGANFAAAIASYYTKTEADARYKPIGYAPTWGEVTGKPSTFPPSVHDHDSRYYTESESDARYLQSYSETDPVAATHAARTDNPHGVTKAQVGLGNVDNTSDAAKPVSGATQTALDGKQPLDDDLTQIAALVPTNDDIIQRKAGVWARRTLAQFRADLAYATVATTGSYNDLSDRPTIPAAQVNSDWNAASGVAQILNKPTIPTNTNQLTNGAGFITSAGAPVQSVAGKTGAVSLAVGDVSGAAPLASPTLSGTTTLPHLVFPTASTGLQAYNTADQTTNFERFVGRWAGSYFELGAEFGGTGNARPLRVGVAATNSSGINRYLQVQASAPFFSYQFGGTGLAGYTVDVGGGNAYSASSGNQGPLSITPTVNQSGTAGYTGIAIFPFEQATGSGPKWLFRAGTSSAASGGGTLTERFAITNTGNVSWSGTATGDGSGLTTLNASNLGSGSIPAGRFGSATVPISALNATGGTLTDFLRKDGTWASAGGGSGTVTSFSAGDLSPLFTTSEATTTTTPALSFTLSNAAQNAFLAGPSAGGAGAPTYRAIVAADVPTLNQNTTGTASNVTGTVAVANGGTGATDAATARTNLAAQAADADLDDLADGSLSGSKIGTGIPAGNVTTGTLDIARLPTGTTSTTVPLGNDARFSDTRTPTDNTVSTAKLVDGNVTTAKLEGGSSSPGNSKYYGTNGSGTKGFHDLPAGGGGSSATVMNTADQTGITTAVDITGLTSATLETSTRYRLTAFLPMESSSNTNGCQVAFTLPTGSTWLAGDATINNTSATYSTYQLTASGTFAGTANQWQGSNAMRPYRVEVTFRTSTTAGTVQARVQRSGSGTCIVREGATMTISKAN